MQLPEIHTILIYGTDIVYVTFYGINNEYFNGGRIMNAEKRALLSVAMVLLIGMLCVSGAHAWNEAQLQLLKTTNSCPNCDLTGANLSYANLNNANLLGANLRTAHLYKAHLYKANLSGANLLGANLYRANLLGADLSGANLTGADLRDAMMISTNLTGANLNGADLTGARLSGATWTDGSLCRKASYGECYRGQP